MSKKYILCLEEWFDFLFLMHDFN